MVGMVQARWAERAAGLLNSAKSSGNIASKLEQLRQLREVLLTRDSSLLPEFAPRLTELDVQLPGAARKLLIEILGEIGKRHVELLPEIIPALITFLKDETPPVARQAIVTGTSLFCNVLVKVAIQGLKSSEVNATLKSSWASMLKFKNAVLPLASQPGIDGVRLLAVKFIEAIVLLYTPDPTLPSDLPDEFDGIQFSISWLKGGHPLLNVGDLAIEASQSLRLLLDQLKFPQVKSLSNSIVIVLINSLSAIAKRRPSFYGRILPVLFSLDPEMSVVKGVQIPGAHHALKNAFMACLQCTHSSAAPWRARLVEALRVMNSGEPGEQPVKHEKNLEIAATGMDGSVYGKLNQLKEDKSLLQASDEVHSDLGRKRSLDEESHDALTDDLISEKRIRQSPTVKDSIQTGLVPVQNEPPSCDSMPSTTDGDSGAVLQLVRMFGALVAQGQKASEPLEILISSISSDLLAEVVLANMRYLPSSCPKSDDEDESNCSMSSVSGLQSSTSASNTFSLSNAFSLITSQLNSQPLLSQDMNTIHIKREEDVITKEEKAVTSSGADDALIVPGMQTYVATTSFYTEKTNAALQLYADESETVEGKIPGLDSRTCFNETQELPDAPLTFEEIKEPTLEHAISSGVTISLDISPSTSMISCSLETLSPRATVTDASEAPSISSHVSSSHYFLPKMVTFNVDLTDEQKDQLQKVTFMRILEAYKQVAVSGGSSVHLSLLAHLGTEFPLDLDPWGLLQKHVMFDYVNHEGHELTLRVLYRLYREAEQDHDFLSSRTATSVYESFLLNVAEALRDTFPASDKSLGRLLGEVPYLSEGILRMLECLCSPESKEKQDDFQSGDRVTQGLSTVWSLILHRPSSRDRCLHIVLQSAVHHMEEVRTKAIRLVANKLFPMSSISQKIEDFASEKLHLVLDNIPSPEDTGVNESSHAPQKESDLGKSSSRGPLPSGGLNIESLSDGLSIKGATSSFSEAQRCMSLYFALCTKKHSLLRQIFAIYKSFPKAAIEAIHRHIPILVRIIGSSPELLSIVSDPPSGSENLLMKVLQILTSGAVPSQELISSVRSLYNSKMKDVDILIPILSFLSKDEILPLIPHLVNLPLDKFQVALTRILQGSPQSGDSLTPAEVLISIHGIDSEKDGVPLKKIMDACSACFEQRLVFTQQVLAKVLNQLVEQIPLPLLFMRTVIQAISVFPGLVDFVMEILSRLVSKQIWKYPKLWVGFLKCALQTKPQSFNVLLQLPAAQLENALNKNPVLKPPLVEHANQPNIRSTLPRSTLVVLGLASDPQRSGQVSQTSGQVQQTSQSQAADTASSTADPATEATQ